MLNLTKEENKWLSYIFDAPDSPIKELIVNQLHNLELLDRMGDPGLILIFNNSSDIFPKGKLEFEIEILFVDCFVSILIFMRENILCDIEIIKNNNTSPLPNPNSMKIEDIKYYNIDEKGNKQNT